jgi:hypothetical protein
MGGNDVADAGLPLDDACRGAGDASNLTDVSIVEGPDAKNSRRRFSDSG